MRILFFVGMPLPKAAHLVNEKPSVFGGWLTTIVDNISKKDDVNLAVVAPYNLDNIIHETIDGVEYYFIPKKGLYDVQKNDCKKVIDEFKPDILHIEGTEYKHHNTMIKSWDGKVVVSLQGIINAYYNYYDGGLNVTKMVTSFNLYKVIAGLSIIAKKTILKKRLFWERDTISLSSNILGRTWWDNSYAKKYNPEANYFNCNRILRDPFYKESWDASTIEKYSIYIGNTYQPLKGAHFVIEAIAKLKNKYSDIKLYVAGISPYDRNVKKNIFKNGYAAYLRYLIKKYHLSENIVFLGTIDAVSVAEKLKQCHVYCLPSAIENSPNTLGEAMLLGVPSVTSFVGGVSDMAKDNEEALFYRFDEVDVLVNQISRIFENDELASELSRKAKIKASITHSSEINIDRLYNCYKSIMNNN